MYSPLNLTRQIRARGLRDGLRRLTGCSRSGGPFFRHRLEQQCYALPILQILLDLLPVFCYVIATGLPAALSTIQVVGGIEGLASIADIVLP
jgi:hypothetical protein